jgi:integrase
MKPLADSGSDAAVDAAFPGATRLRTASTYGWIDVLGGRLSCKLRRQRRNFDFDQHPLRELIIPFLLRDHLSRAVGTIAVEASHIGRIGVFFQETGHTQLTPQVFNELLTWLENQPGVARSRQREARQGSLSDSRLPRRLAEDGQRATAEAAIRIYAYGLRRVPPYAGWSITALETMTTACSKRFRGSWKRVVHKKRETAVTREEFTRLLRAIRLEMEECERVLAQRSASETAPLGVSWPGTRGRPIDPNPYVCFALLAAMEAALRAAEFNNLCVGDESRRAGLLYAHAPNKPPRYLPLTPEMQRALDLVMIWSNGLREVAVDRSPLLLFSWGDPSKTGLHKRRARGVRRVTSDILNKHWLPNFYRKYFGVADTGRPLGPGTAIAPQQESIEEASKLQTEQPLPVLYADRRSADEPLRPFAIAYADLRAAGLLDRSKEERNRHVLQRHAGHARFSTTEQYYLEQEDQERLRDTSRYLLPHAERLRMRMHNRVIAEPGPAEMAQLAARGALIPILRTPTPAVGGHCGDTAVGEIGAAPPGMRPGCKRSGDCRLCGNFQIYASRRPVYVSSMEHALKQAEKQQRRGNLRESENLRQSAALDQAIIHRIDEFASAPCI